MTKKLSNRVIYKDEDCYGFLSDIIQDLEYSVEADIEIGWDGELFKEALDKARELYEDDDNFDKIFRLMYHPMGGLYIRETHSRKNYLKSSLTFISFI